MNQDFLHQNVSNRIVIMITKISTYNDNVLTLTLLLSVYPYLQDFVLYYEYLKALWHT